MDDDGDFNGAIGKLCKLIGWNYPAADIPKDLKQVSFPDIFKQEPKKKENEKD